MCTYTYIYICTSGKWRQHGQVVDFMRCLFRKKKRQRNTTPQIVVYLCFVFSYFFTGHVITIFQLEMIQMYFFIFFNNPNYRWSKTAGMIHPEHLFRKGLVWFEHFWWESTNLVMVPFESQYSLVIEHSCENSLFVIGKSS